MIECARFVGGIACALLLLPILLATAFFVWIHPELEPRVCERSEMTLGGIPYKIELCITSDFDTRQEFHRLRIYDSSESTLLAHRRFVVIMGLTQDEIEYLENGIRYIDASKTQNDGLSEEKVLQFPPTKWDWLTANLIRLTYEP